MIHYTYLLIDENKKKYGGVRSCETTPENDTYMGSSYPVKTAMKNGLIFTKHIVKEFDTREEANEYESSWLVSVSAAQSDDWYNQSNTYPKFDQHGKKQTEEHIRKRVEKITGQKRTEETKRNMSKAQTGRKHLDKSKRKMSKAKKGVVPWNKGIPHSEETNRKISETKRKKNANIQ